MNCRNIGLSNKICISWNPKELLEALNLSIKTVFLHSILNNLFSSVVHHSHSICDQPVTFHRHLRIQSMNIPVKLYQAKAHFCSQLCMPLLSSFRILYILGTYLYSQECHFTKKCQLLYNRLQFELIFKDEE